jgi:hypothetical protein
MLDNPQLVSHSAEMVVQSVREGRTSMTGETPPKSDGDSA